MSRPSLRRTPALESLEVRQVLSTVAVTGPTPDQQYALELINLVRTDPSAAVTEITANLSPDVKATLNQYGLTVAGLVSKMDSASAQPPLAWNDSLAASAQQQSQYEANNSVQTHQGSGEQGLQGRMNSAGYNNIQSYGENTYAYAESIDEAMQSFLFDWGVSDDGHYNNLLQPGTSAENAYSDVGIGLVNSTNGVGPLVLTQDFGSQFNEGPQIVGVVYNDPDHTGIAAEGQGLGGVTVDIKNLSTGQDSQTQTWSAGGYQMPVAANTSYQVTAIQNGQVIASQTVNVGEVNVEADLVNNPAAQVSQAQAVQVPTTTSTQAPDTSIQASQSNSSSQQQSQSSDQSQSQAPAQQNQSSGSDDVSSLSLAGWSHWTAS